MSADLAAVTKACPVGSVCERCGSAFGVDVIVRGSPSGPCCLSECARCRDVAGPFTASTAPRFAAEHALHARRAR